MAVEQDSSSKGTLYIMLQGQVSDVTIYSFNVQVDIIKKSAYFAKLK